MCIIPTNWRILHIVTSKIPNGNPANINGLAESIYDFARLNDHDSWHHGDWEGIRLYALPFAKLYGFNAIQISPVLKQGTGTKWKGKRYSPYHAYHIEQLWENQSAIQLEPHFGTRSELEALISEAHAMGIQVIADLVPNHRGYETPQLLENPEFFHNISDIALAKKAGDVKREVEVTPMGGLPDLRQSHPEVVRRLDEEFLFHIHLGFDGWRVDAMMHLDEDFRTHMVNTSPLAGFPIVGKNSKPLFGENYSGSLFHDDEDVPSNGHLAMWQNGYGSTGHAWFFQIQIECSKKFGDVNKISEIQRLFVEYDSQTVNFVDNHDTDRSMSAALVEGNSVEAATERTLMQYVLLYGFRNAIAVLYAFENLPEGRGVRDTTSCRVPWTPFEHQTPLLYLVQKLNSVRASRPCLEQGWYSERYTGNGVLAYIRGLDHNAPILVVANIWDTSVQAEYLEGSICIGDQFADNTILVDLTGQLNPGVFYVKDGRLHGVIPPRSAFLLSAV
jgi:glycosidase